MLPKNSGNLRYFERVILHPWSLLYSPSTVFLWMNNYFFKTNIGYTHTSLSPEWMFIKLPLELRYEWVNASRWTKRVWLLSFWSSTPVRQFCFIHRASRVYEKGKGSLRKSEALLFQLQRPQLFHVPTIFRSSDYKYWIRNYLDVENCKPAPYSLGQFNTQCATTFVTTKYDV